MSNDELINLVLEKQAEIEALRMKLDKGIKPPTNSGNSSQPPSKDQKGNLPEKRKRHKHGPPKGHEKHEREFVAQLDPQTGSAVESTKEIPEQSPYSLFK